MCIVKNWFFLYIVNEVKTMTIRIKIVSQFYSILQFLRANFSEVDYNERAFITIIEKKISGILQSRSLQDITGKNINICNSVMWQKNSSFRLNIVNEKLT